MYGKNKWFLAMILMTILTPCNIVGAVETDDDSFSFVTAKGVATNPEKANSLTFISKARKQLQDAIDAHNTLFTLYDDVDVIDKFEENILKHLESLEVLKVNDQCSVDNLSNNFMNPEELWYGKECNLACKENDYEAREGITGTAVKNYTKELGEIDIDYRDATLEELKELDRLPWKVGQEILVDMYANQSKWGTTKNKFPLWEDQVELYDQYKKCLADPYYDYDEFGYAGHKSDCGKNTGIDQIKAFTTPMPPYTELMYYEPYEKGVSLLPYEGLPDAWKLFFRMKGGEDLYGRYTEINKDGEFADIYKVTNNKEGLEWVDADVSFALNGRKNNYRICNNNVNSCLAENRVSKWLKLRKEEMYLQEASDDSEEQLDDMEVIIREALARIGYEVADGLDVKDPEVLNDAIAAIQTYKEGVLEEVSGIMENVSLDLDEEDLAEEVLQNRTASVENLVTALTADTEGMLNISDKISDEVDEVEDQILKNLEERMDFLEYTAGVEAQALAAYEASGFNTGCFSF